MHSFLITSKNKQKAKEYTYKLCIDEKIDPIDINLNSFEKAVGIEDIRNIQKKIILKPFKSKTKAIIIESYEGITTESQNALLKILEEPPANTIIIISISNKKLLLPTILSRCKIIELSDEKLILSNDEITQLHNYLITVFRSGVGDKLKLAQDIARNKDEVLPWLEKMAIFVREKLIENPREVKYLNFLKSLQKTYVTLKSTNVNQRIALENLFLSF